MVTNAGKINTGGNVENVSLGLTICAVVTAGKKPAIPCGAGRQVLAEFNPNIKVLAATIDGKVQEFDLAELFPFPSQGILEGSRDV